MSDRDIPSVPVTTLAGLNSLSDLLSELPVSDSLANVTAAHKSLLFHTLVASESDHLLAVRDDSLVRQLVHAIEQTNSDNIELKSQYTIQQHGANISTFPELLQGIYNYRPTVFNTPKKRTQTHHQQQQHPVQQLQHQQYQLHHHYHHQHQQQTIHTAHLLSSAKDGNCAMEADQLDESLLRQTNFQANDPNVAVLGRSETMPFEAQHEMNMNSFALHHAKGKTHMDNEIGEMNCDQLQRNSIEPSLTSQLQMYADLEPSLIFSKSHGDTQTQYHQIRSQGMTEYSARLQGTQSDVQVGLSGVQGQPQQIVENVVQQQQLKLPKTSVIQMHGRIVSAPGETETARAAAMIVDQTPPQPMRTPVKQQQQQSSVTKSQTRALNEAPQNEAGLHQQQVGQVQGNFQNVLYLQRQRHQQQLQQQQQNSQSNSNNTNSNKLAIDNRLEVSVGVEDAQLAVQQQSEATTRTQPFDRNAFVVESSAAAGVAHSTAMSTISINSFGGDDKQCARIAEIEMVAPLMASSGGVKSQVRVCMSRLRVEEARLLQQSIKAFVQKSPELAKKFGLPIQAVLANTAVTTAGPAASTSAAASATALHADDTSIPTMGNAIQNRLTQSLPVADMFTIMKADERRSASATKRKLPVTANDLPPEQIFSKPKVRRVERTLATHLPKCSKDEVLRSQTYQQFMRNMEQIIENLDDTETPNFDSDEVDENIECISSKMLTTMSNDVAKLKAKHVLDSIPKNKLTLLINYAMRNVYLAKNYSAGPDDEDELVDDETMDKILNAIEACLLICNIYSTAKDLKFLQEDNISLIIKFVQFQLRETIFPSFDPVYTVKSMKKADNRKKTKAHQNHNRSLQLLYSKTVELLKVFVSLFDKCIFVDTIVLPLSTLAIEPFFVDNIETLQFVCLELVTTIFRKELYDKIRSSILGDILSSIDRLPSSKKNLRPFKLTNNGGNIQMVTALVLQLIQCATILPDSICDGGSHKTKAIAFAESAAGAAPGNGRQYNDVIVLKKYDVAISIGGNFLTTFLNKCKTRSNETDFRPLFENFIHDLLATVNKPEWPASELLLSLLGTMLVRYVSDKSIEQSIRLVSLDYLGIVAARLRKDTVESRCKVHIIDSMINSIKAEQEKEGDIALVNHRIQLEPEEERTEFLQKILLDFLAVNAQEENLIWDYARHFYLAQWYRDVIYQRRRIAEGEKGYASRKKGTARKKRRKDESSDSSADEFCASGDDEANATKNGNRATGAGGGIDQELNLEIFNVLEERKRYLLNSIKSYSVSASSTGDLCHAPQHIKTYIDYNNAHLIAQYLATKRPFSQSFDGYLKKIILVVNEPSIAVRTRAMKCLANIVEVDPMVLKRKDMQMGVNQKFLDAAISVREAAVDLVGKFVLSNEELIDQYYDMLSTRILDTGVSVRKRVIKILRDICIEYPDFEKIPEICVKMIRRVNDEEGIQKLVTEVFMKMWFTPCLRNDKHGIQRKINQIIDVVNTAHDTGTSWLEGLLNSIFQPKESMLKLDGSAQDPVKKNTEPPVEIVLACQQLADGLVERLIELEDTDNSRMLGCITTLHLLARVRPQLLVRHAITIEPYLNIKCHPSTAPKFICAVADILEKVVPLVNYASESFLASLEEHLMLLVVSLNQAVVTSCVSCLGALVNKITKNYKLIRDCFLKFYNILDYSRNQVEQANFSIDRIYTPMFRRSLFTIGILMRYFDFKSTEVIGEASGLPLSICDEAFDCLMFFIQCSNREIQKQALIALGSFCVMNDDYLTRTELKRFYCDLLSSSCTDSGVKIICMRNIWIYLTESEMHMHNKEKEWEKQAKNDDLKEMNDVSSGMASRIIQLYLQEILDCFLNGDDTVRLWAVKVVQIVLRQGLVHPVRMVPYLICLSTDSKVESAHRADALLKDIDKTYAGFVNMKVQFGLQLCFKLQEVLQCNNEGKSSNVIRGYAKKEADAMPSALNDFLYTLLRTTKPQRRALVQTVTKQFDDQKTSLRQMLYIADNLAYFPFIVQDEPLYLIHQIDLLISMAGTNLLATFKEFLKPSECAGDVLEDDDDEEDPAVLVKRLPDNTCEIQKCITSSQACMLLLILKDHLKEMYGLTDGKISRYSPSEQKLYEKAVTRKTVPDFSPSSTIDVIRKQQEQKASKPDEISQSLNDDEKLDLVAKYLDFKKLMLKLDPDDAESDEESRDKSKHMNTSRSDTIPTTSVLQMPASNQTEFNNSVSVDGISTHLPLNAVSSVDQTKDTTPTTPASRAARLVSTGRSTSRKQTPLQRSKKKKRKIISSDEDDEDYSDEGFM